MVFFETLKSLKSFLVFFSVDQFDFPSFPKEFFGQIRCAAGKFLKKRPVKTFLCSF